MLPQAYRVARVKAIAETGLADQTFPENSPFSLDQMLAKDFLPE